MLPIWTKAFRLGFEASQVIWLRSFLIAAGGAAAQREMGLMVSEKVAAALKAQRLLLSGGGADRVVGAYQRKVHQNLRRLSR